MFCIWVQVETKLPNGDSTCMMLPSQSYTNRQEAKDVAESLKSLGFIVEVRST